MNEQKPPKGATFRRILATDEVIMRGQIGNLRVALHTLTETLKVSKGEHFLPFVEAIRTELDLMEKYFPKSFDDVPF